MDAVRQRRHFICRAWDRAHCHRAAQARERLAASGDGDARRSARANGRLWPMLLKRSVIVIGSNSAHSFAATLRRLTRA